MKGLDYRVPEMVDKILFSGEAMPVKHLNIWRQYLPHAKFINLYGPTEITCNCTYYRIEREFSKEEKIQSEGRSPIAEFIWSMKLVKM